MSDEGRKARVKTKVTFGEDAIGDGKLQLLLQVQRTGSISAAAKAQGMGFRRAWHLLDSLQNLFDEPVLITERGGAKAGGTKLTAFGLQLLERYGEHQVAVRAASAPFMQWLAENAKS